MQLDRLEYMTLSEITDRVVAEHLSIKEILSMKHPEPIVEFDDVQYWKREEVEKAVREVLARRPVKKAQTDVTIQSGTLLEISSGRYADYEHRGVYKVLKEFNPWREYKALCSTDLNPTRNLATYLVEFGIIEKLKTSMLFLGEDGGSFGVHPPTFRFTGSD